EVYEELKKIKPGTNVLLVSGSKMDKRIEELIKRGVKGFIEKPYAFDFLIQKVAELIGPVD
ncbi:MAG: response regulator, partial [bacterium]|nr:response regulator [bacterium]